MRNQNIEEHKSLTLDTNNKDNQTKWFDYDDEIAIRVEKSDYTDNKLLITVHLDGGESEVIEKLLVDFKELIGWE